MKRILSIIITLLTLTFGLIEPVTAQATCPDGQQYVNIAINGSHCVPVGGGNINDNIIFRFLVTVIQFVSVGVGLAVTGGILYGSFLYMTARANAGQVERGRNTIVNAIVGLLLFIFMYAIVEFLIPGNIFS